jgi:RimJ/RimL family protein N-acetyltransferase
LSTPCSSTPGENGFARVELGVAAGNTGAERLYARCGFVRNGERVERPAAGICELRMALTL